MHDFKDSAYWMLKLRKSLQYVSQKFKPNHKCFTLPKYLLCDIYRLYFQYYHVILKLFVIIIIIPLLPWILCPLLPLDYLLKPNYWQIIGSDIIEQHCIQTMSLFKKGKMWRANTVAAEGHIHCTAI